jgi:hypothetical protein
VLGRARGDAAQSFRRRAGRSSGADTHDGRAAKRRGTVGGKSLLERHPRHPRRRRTRSRRSIIVAAAASASAPTTSGSYAGADFGLRAPGIAGLVPVAPSQWPYDEDLLAAILADDASHGYIKAVQTVGVADGGLGSLWGRPLPDSVFKIDGEKLVNDDGEPEPDNRDEDDNDYFDDVFGAGVPRSRPSLVRGIGDLGLCNAAPPSFSSWVSNHSAPSVTGR